MLLFELIRVSIGFQTALSRKPSDNEWYQLYKECCHHAIAGVVFLGIQRLPQNQRPPKFILYQWISIDEQIRQKNEIMNKRCLELQHWFANGGFNTCILKGQGNSLMYNEPLCRQSGDIDIWVSPPQAQGYKHIGIKNIVDYLKSRCDISGETIAYHHMEFPLWKDVAVEVHWRPSWRSSVIYNFRLQKWFKTQAENQFANIDERTGMHVPTWEFNVIYQLQHMFLHIFQEGLGLRQVIDYYYLLKEREIIETDDVAQHLHYLGLYNFAGAMMYVMRNVFSLDERCMIVPVDEKRGKFLLSEILKSGNFGQHDIRNQYIRDKKGIKRSLAKLKRQYRYLRHYPHETLCAPFQVYHVIWRKLQMWRWE